MKAVQTMYNGYKFRSRLEAKWAVFFDAAGIKYEYEKEGFELESGERYLPDFWLPEQRLWLEVKGGPISISEFAKIKAFHDALATESGEIPGVDDYEYPASFYILHGEPFYNGTVHSYVIEQLSQLHKESDYVLRDSRDKWTHCPLCQRLDIRPFWSQYGVGTEGTQCMYCDVVDRSHADSDETWFHKGDIETKKLGFILNSPALKRAYKAARSARFEHGETPKP